MKNNKFLQTVLVTLSVFAAAVFAGPIFAQKTSTSKAKASSTVKIGGTNSEKKSEKSDAAAVSSKIKQIDGDDLKKILTPDGKPLLINFWATWCDPCREEFPDLVKIDGDYKGKIDFSVVSLDDLSEINHDVPDFLTQMKAEMPAYLLKVPNEDEVISSVSRDWQGGLPFTVLYDSSGKIVYTNMGKVKIAELRGKIESLISASGNR